MKLTKAALRHLLAEALPSPLIPCATDPYLDAIYNERMFRASGTTLSWQNLAPVMYFDCAWTEL